MIPQMPQLATAVGRPPITGGVTTPNPAAAPRLAAPAVNTGRVGRPPMPGGGAPRSFAVKLGGGAPGGQGRPLPGRSRGPAQPTAQGAQGVMGGWNADPSLVQNAVKVLKAGAELGPQHRGPLNQLLANTDSVARGPFQAPAGREGFASKFSGGSIA